jgi:type II secretory pathway component PulF
MPYLSGFRYRFLLPSWAIMFTVVIPKISSIITDSGQPIPIYTLKIVMVHFNFFVHYIGIFVLVAFIIIGFLLIKLHSDSKRQSRFDEFKLAVPYVGTLFRKLYLSRIADNMNTMLISGIPMIKALEVTRIDRRQWCL